jgi:hypothetical protein
VLVVFSFTVGFSAAFGSSTSHYRTLGDSFMTTIKMAWGDFSAYDEIQKQNFILAPILFISFIFFVSLILLVIEFRNLN